MIGRSTRLILIADATILLTNVVSSLIGARALGPAGRGDLLVVVLWPPVIAMLTGLGLPTAYRYWMAREPNRISQLFSNAVIYSLLAGLAGLAVSELVVTHVVGERSPEVILLLRIYLFIVPNVLFTDLMRSLLEGTRRFGWGGLIRLVFFLIQATGFAGLWIAGRLSIATGAYTMMTAQTVALLLALSAVFRELKPRWAPSWSEFKTSMSYGLRDYPGGVADFTTLRLDQLMLGALASNVAIGLYVIAVRLSEMTTLVAGAIGSALMPEVAGMEKKGETLWARSFRFAIYINVLMIVPLWLGASFILKILFGPSFVPAAGAFRWLLLAAMVLGCGSIVISGLRGFGHPGLSTLARFSAAVATAITLPFMLRRLGINGAALASLIGYSTMLTVALVAFALKRRVNLWKSLRPRREDIAFANWKTIRNFVFPKPLETVLAPAVAQKEELAG
ncbi:MAG TPA: oligosaccharide flippase family protein [Pyrinomonadaceae bacterium]|jgi:O-antigen/teichoic acid export membrane protein